VSWATREGTELGSESAVLKALVVFAMETVVVAAGLIGPVGGSTTESRAIV
jgi:hypothetical protein